MNYILEINAFYDWLEINSLSTSGIVLWHGLMHINNKAGWAEEFTVATSVLSIKTGLSERTIRNARNELKQKSRIEWKSRGGNKAAAYKIIPLSAQYAGKRTNKDDKNNLSALNADSNSGNVSGKYADSSSDNVSTLNKLNGTKLNETTTTNNSIFKSIVNKFQNNGFGMINFDTKEMLLDLAEFYSEDWLDEALDIAIKSNARNIKYVEGILKKWHAKGKNTDTRKKNDEHNPYAGYTWEE